MNYMKINRTKIANILIANGYYSVEGISGKEEMAAINDRINSLTDAELMTDYYNCYMKDANEYTLIHAHPELFTASHIYRNLRRMLNYHDMVEEFQEYFYEY